MSPRADDTGERRVVSAPDGAEPRGAIDPTERIDLLLRDLRGALSGLSSREAARRLDQFGPNVLVRRGGRRWPRELARQFVHPLALLLWVAAGLAWAAGIVAVAVAIVVVILINAAFAFAQEMQAERAVEALAAYLPTHAKVLRDGQEQQIDATALVPGDVLVIEEGDRISADARLVTGGIEVDLSMLSGESMPAFRSAELLDTRVPLLRARDLVFSGTACTEGSARALVFATGMHTDSGASIAIAVAAGRRIYDNIRKFLLYIFAHTIPEVTPFVVFALGGGAIPLPLTVLQLLAFDIGTETLPALALGREPPEPGLMQQPPRKRSESVIQPPMLLRAWLFLGPICAALAMAGFFYVMLDAGWHPGDPTGDGTPLHHAYQQATTMTFLGMIAGQIGTAFAARTDRASLRSVGAFSNRLLLWGIAFELVVAAILIYTPVFQSLLATAALDPGMLLFVAPFPFIVWGADELRRWALRRRSARDATGVPANATGER